MRLADSCLSASQNHVSLKTSYMIKIFQGECSVTEQSGQLEQELYGSQTWPEETFIFDFFSF